MVQVEIYTTKICPYCVRAKQLLGRKNVSYIEHDLTDDDAARDALVKKTGLRTVPQIFVGGTLVGGCDDLYALDKKGELDKMLANG